MLFGDLAKAPICQNAGMIQRCFSAASNGAFYFFANGRRDKLVFWPLEGDPT